MFNFKVYKQNLNCVYADPHSVYFYKIHVVFLPLNHNGNI